MQRRFVVVALFACVLAASAIVPAAAAQEPIKTDAPFYDGENGTTNTTGWLPDGGNATADGMLEMLARIPGIYIGSGGLDPSGSGYQGILLLGLVIASSALFAMRGAGVGPIAGSMIGLTVAFGLTTTGIAPRWVQPLLLFALGIPVATAVIRVFQG